MIQNAQTDPRYSYVHTGLLMVFVMLSALLIATSISKARVLSGNL